MGRRPKGYIAPPVKSDIMEKRIELVVHGVVSMCESTRMNPQDAKVYLECVIERLQQAVEEIEEEHGL